MITSLLYSDERDGWEELDHAEINESIRMSKLQKRKAAYNQRIKESNNNAAQQPTPTPPQNESGIRRL